MTLPIVHFNSPILRKKGVKVTTFDADLARLAADMIDTMHDAAGIGLAAQQGRVERLHIDRQQPRHQQQPRTQPEPELPQGRAGTGGGRGHGTRHSSCAGINKFICRALVRANTLRSFPDP